MEADELPSIARISPTGTRLVTFHITHNKNYVLIRGTENGRFLANLLLNHPIPPLDVAFESEDQFYSHHETFRIPYVFVTSPEVTVSDSIICRGQLPLAFQRQEGQFFVDDSHEWVVSRSQRICWIPPGYIGYVQASSCWAGSTLVMAGQDGTLRKLTFRESFL